MLDCYDTAFTRLYDEDILSNHHGKQSKMTDGGFCGKIRSNISNIRMDHNFSEAELKVLKVNAVSNATAATLAETNQEIFQTFTICYVYVVFLVYMLLMTTSMLG